jgi:hypothetical protein
MPKKVLKEFSVKTEVFLRKLCYIFPLFQYKLLSPTQQIVTEVSVFISISFIVTVCLLKGLLRENRWVPTGTYYYRYISVISTVSGKRCRLLLLNTELEIHFLSKLSER